ncbi:hypothetical protein EDD22DRAFT_917530 [Suillus occidentalis]|nr:hypothetical protein EDD22DRAFT_917530 [Suillus occidentalis]
MVRRSAVRSLLETVCVAFPCPDSSSSSSLSSGCRDPSWVGGEEGTPSLSPSSSSSESRGDRIRIAAFLGGGGSAALDNARFLTTVLEEDALSASRTRAEGLDVRVERREPAAISAGVCPNLNRAENAFFAAD